MLHANEWCCPSARENPLLEVGIANSRKKIWDLGKHFHCSIVGTCLHPFELKKLATKSRLSLSDVHCDYHLHQLVVAQVGYRKSRLAKLVQNHLDKKYKATLHVTSELTSAVDLQQYWADAHQRSDIHAAYWALVTHPMASQKLCEKAYGQIHMLSHLSGENRRGQEQKIAHLKKQYSLMEEKYRASLLKNRERIKEKNRELERIRTRPEQTASERSDPSANLRLRIEAENLTAKLSMERLKRERVEDELHVALSAAERLRDQLAERDALIETLRKQAESAAGLLAVADADDADALDSVVPLDQDQEVDLVGRCILYVGGRSRQCSRFRQMVAKRNGKFLHHDGGLEDTNRLDSVLARADAVMCPLDCISHNAMNKAKKYCKNAGKPLIMLEKSSLSAFSNGLGKVLNQ